jgi:hypothetical protein
VVRAALEQLGFRLLLPRTPFDYLAWRDEPGDGPAIEEPSSMCWLQQTTTSACETRGV